MSKAFDPNAAASPGSGIFGLPFVPEESSLVLIPVPWEATASYGGGASRGPAAILEASRQVDLFDLEAGEAYRAGIAMLADSGEVRAWNDQARPLARQVIAAGGVEVTDPGLTAARETVNRLSEMLNEWVESQSREWLEAGKAIGILGGDHSVAFGGIRAAAERLGPLGILQLDAHFDLRHAYEGFAHSHASVMENVLRTVPMATRLIQVGIRDFCQEEYDRARSDPGRVRVHFDHALAAARFDGKPWNQLVEAILLDLPERVWLSFDIDGLDPSLCPHTGTPVPGGLGFNEVVALVRAVARSGRHIVGFDLTEVAPGPGPDDTWDANVGARLLYQMSLWTLLAKR